MSPLLFTLLFAAIDYGLYFADVMTVEQGASNAAREATLSVGSVAANWPGAADCPYDGTSALDPSATDDLAKVVCRLSETVRPVAGGTLVVKAEIVDATGAPSAAWAIGSRLRVCAATRHDAVLPFVPLPGGGVVTSRVDMPIQPGGAPLRLAPVQQDISGLRTDWSWC